MNDMSQRCVAAVIIPILNEEGLIGSSLNSLIASVLATDRTLIEIVLVDNNSNDNTNKIISGIIKPLNSPPFHLLVEKERGIGHARAAGARFILKRESLRTQHNEKFWIINTDADTTFPKNWLTKWLNYLSATNKSIITGNATFPSNFQHNFPITNEIILSINKKIRIMENIFGVINIDGFNSAIEKNCYLLSGQFIQPYTNKNKIKLNLAGEDWDISTRSAIKGFIPARFSDSEVTVSARRLEINPKAYIDGRAYESSFSKVTSNHLPSSDISKRDLKKYLKIATKRQCIHYVEKPILISPEKLHKDSVRNFLGKQNAIKMEKWILTNAQPGFENHRNDFMSYMQIFHERFGDNICSKVMNYES